jgi:hypothetical protein
MQSPPSQQDLFSLLLGATEPAAAAGSGLTADLTASFSALLDTLPPDQQAAKVHLWWRAAMSVASAC